jgi:chromate transporter
MLLFQIFWLFTRVALLSWGGGPASLALMQRETVAAGWVTASEFADSVAIGNSLPGPIAPQVSAFVGYKLAGFWGAVAGAVGTVVPTTLIMLAAIAYFYKVKDTPAMKAMLTAVRPVVIGFLLWTAYDVAATVFKAPTLGWGPALLAGWDKVILVLLTFALLVLTKINPALVILGAAVIGLLIYR